MAEQKFNSIEEMLAAANQPTQKYASVDEMMASSPQEVSPEMSSAANATQFYKTGTPPAEIAKQEQLLHQSAGPEPNWLRFSKWTIRQVGKTAPYLAAGELGAGLVPKGVNVFLRPLASSVAQGVYAGIKEKSPVVGLETAGASLVGEGVPTYLGARSALKRGVPPAAVAGTLERSTPGRINEMFGKVTPKAEADVARAADTATNSAWNNKSQGRINAETQMAMADKLRSGLGMGKAINTAPIKQALLDQVLPTASLPERQALNEWLTERAQNLPSRMSHEELDAFIREWSDSIQSTYGKMQITVPQEARDITASAARNVRGKALPSAEPDFAAAEEHLRTTKALRSMLVDAHGELKTTAPNIWHDALTNDIVYKKLTDFENATGNDVTTKGMSMARKKAWTTKGGGNSLGVIRLTSTPNPVASVRTPSAMGKLMIAGSRPAGAITSRMMMERYKASQQKEGNEPSPEQLFPGMTNAPAQENP